MNEEPIEEFEAVPLDESICPVGGGHQCVPSGRCFQGVTGKLLEIITCIKCGLVTVGWSHSPSADVMDVEWEVVE